MSNKHFTYLVLITISLFVLALLSFLIQPRYETSLKRGEAAFKNIKNQLNDIKEINIDNSKKKIKYLNLFECDEFIITNFLLNKFRWCGHVYFVKQKYYNKKD